MSMTKVDTNVKYDSVIKEKAHKHKKWYTLFSHKTTSGTPPNDPKPTKTSTQEGCCIIL